MIIKDKLNKKQKRRMYNILDRLPDSIVLHFQHYAALGRKLNLKKPARFTDKIQWYKLNYRNPLMTICADKYKIREHISGKGYSDYVPKLYQVCDNFSEINFNKLPNKFAIKSNNGSGTNLFIKDKENMDIEKIKNTINSWEKVNTLSIGREWAYENIEPKIVIEELLTPQDDFQKKHGLNDYKFLCFNGDPMYVWVDINRETNHSRNIYDLDWDQRDVITDKPRYLEEIPKPYGFNKMMEISRKLAADFPFVRVDFYSLNNKVYIGEMTFYPWSGTVQFAPDSFDYRLGELFDLSQITTLK